MNMPITIDEIAAQVQQRMTIGNTNLAVEAQRLGLEAELAKKIPAGITMDGLDVRPMTAAELLRGAGPVRDDWQDMATDLGRGGDVPLAWHPSRDIGRSQHGSVTRGYLTEMMLLQQSFGGQRLKVADEYGTRESVFRLSGSPWGMNADMGATTERDAQQLYDLFHSQYAKVALDIAPNLFIAQELIAASNKIIERDRVEMTARQLFPTFRVNTWFTQWFLQRVDDASSGMSQFSDPESPANRVPQATVYRDQTPYPLAFHEAGATWHAITLARIAEARANGFPGSINFEAMVLASTRRMLLVRENVMTFWDEPKKGTKGFLGDDTGIPRWPATAKLGTGDSIQDYNIVVEIVKWVIDRTVNTDRPNTLGVGTKTWLHLNTRVYETDGTGGSETIASMVLKAIQPMGISQIRWVPEFGFREQEKQQWLNFGFTADESSRWAGGINEEEVMACWNNNAESGEMIVGRDLAMFPDEVMVRGQTSVTMTMSNGGYKAYKPKRFAIITNIGPDTVFLSGAPVVDENDGE